MKAFLNSWAKWALLGVFLAGFTIGEPLEAQPRDELNGTVDEVIAILKNPSFEGAANTQARRDRLRLTIGPRFDFREMAKRSLARHWRDRSEEERDEFVAVFADLLEQSYVSRIEDYTDQEILYPEERIEDNFAEVGTKIVVESGREVPIDYRLYQTESGWRVYDIVIEGVSLVSNYRSQFNRIINQNSYDALLNRMHTKQEEEAGN